MRIIAIALLFCCAALGTPVPCCAEQLALNLDGSKWKLGYSVENKEQGIQEFCPVNETVDAWSELVTIQAFFKLQERTSAEGYMNTMIKNLKQAYPTTACSVIRKGVGDVVFEWELKNAPGQENQCEIDRVVAGKTALWVLHYATKKLPVSPEKRDEWIRILESAKLINQ